VEVSSVNWNEQYHNAKHGGPPPRGPLTSGHYYGKAAREVAQREEDFKRRERDSSNDLLSRPVATRPVVRRRPSARQLRRLANPPPEYAGLRKASNVLGAVLFVILAVAVSYQSFMSNYALDEKIAVPLIAGLLGAAIGKAPLMLIRWVLRAIWDPPA